LQELDNLIELLEADIPANPSAPKNIRLADDLEHELKKYFKQVEDMMPDLTKVYNKYVEET
jgi:hypothetical protein